jgi:ABC-type multidrug transport system fused ATPase/permease subunit
MRRYVKWTLMAVLAGSLQTGFARPQAVPPQNLLTDSNASTTRDQLSALLNQYPPTVLRLLQIDSSLLNNKDFMTLYPALNAFVVKHPEIAHNPAYFLGTQRGPAFNFPVERSEDRTARDIAEYMTVALVVMTIAGAITWIIRSLIDYRRSIRMTRTQTEIHSRLLDRLTTSEDLLAYIQSPAGKRFLESAPPVASTGDAGSTLGRILSSVQAGLVLVLGGIGLNYASGRITNQASQPFFVLGVLALAVGIGFILSAVASYIIARNVGLIHGPGTSETPPT